MKNVLLCLFLFVQRAHCAEAQEAKFTLNRYTLFLDITCYESSGAQWTLTYNPLTKTITTSKKNTSGTSKAVGFFVDYCKNNSQQEPENVQILIAANILRNHTKDEGIKIFLGALKQLGTWQPHVLETMQNLVKNHERDQDDLPADQKTLCPAVLQLIKQKIACAHEIN